MEALNHLQSNQDRLYNAAYSLIGYDLSKQAPNDLGCAESVSRVIIKAFPEMRFPLLLNTKELYEYFSRSPSFELCSEPEYGTIIISVTGTGIMKHGHVGIFGKRDSEDGTKWIMSNDSRTGEFRVNWTYASWLRYYVDRGGLDTFIFRVV